MTVPEVDIEAFAALHATGVPVIDVREPHEYEEGHVRGTVTPLRRLRSDQLGDSSEPRVSKTS